MRSAAGTREGDRLRVGDRCALYTVVGTAEAVQVDPAGRDRLDADGTDATLTNLAIDDDFAGRLYDSAIDGSDAVYVHRGGAYTAEVRDALLGHDHVDVVLLHDRHGDVHQPSRVRLLGRGFERTVQKERIEIGEIRLVLLTEALLFVVQHHGSTNHEEEEKYERLPGAGSIRAAPNL
jgi:hypothetical protein